MSLVLACFFTTPSPVPPPERKEIVIEQIVGLPGKEVEIKFSDDGPFDKKKRNQNAEGTELRSQNTSATSAYNCRGTRNH
ncbi:MAG: hypothetical protein J6Y91_01015 [Alphaproteobacteria bacterium]|nr:hypothetical protein [Alphaproteobacteria bacterium]